jgi:3-hydroxyisobutyrate dehydrogenase
MGWSAFSYRVKAEIPVGHHMAINLFTKTLIAHQTSNSSDVTPTFAICEQDDSRAEAFVRDLREKGGIEFAQSVERVENGAE